MFGATWSKLKILPKTLTRTTQIHIHTHWSGLVIFSDMLLSRKLLYLYSMTELDPLPTHHYCDVCGDDNDSHPCTIPLFFLLLLIFTTTTRTTVQLLKLTANIIHTSSDNCIITDHCSCSVTIHHFS